MKRVAIITLYGNSNYGNKLQNYAIQECLKSKGFEVKTIINTPIYNNRFPNIIRLIKHKINTIRYLIKNGDKEMDFFKHNDTNERKHNFLEFNKYINTTEHIFSFKRIKEFSNFDIFVVGSDQIWNPNYGGLSDLDLLTFTNSKKISISASFGIPTIESKYYNRIKRYLDKFDFISVREKQGKKIINNILPKKDISILIDPTLMLAREQWDKVSKRPKGYLEEDYILCYFLGGINKTLEEKINSFARKFNYKVINILDKRNVLSNSGPSEFLYLEKHAKCILTDSFHSSIFAILYNIPFVVFDREREGMNNMGSRIDTLLATFKLENRRFNGREITEDILKHDYTQAYKILEKERKKSELFLKKALDIKDSD